MFLSVQQLLLELLREFLGDNVCPLHNLYRDAGQVGDVSTERRSCDTLYQFIQKDDLRGLEILEILENDAWVVNSRLVSLHLQ